MNAKKYFHKLTNEQGDFLQEFLDLLQAKKISFCLIGGLGVNAYAEPVVSLDFDVVVISEKIDELLAILKKRYAVKEFTNSINVHAKDSDLRIQIQTDERYQDFLTLAETHDVLGYQVPVARIEDVMQGKIWAAMDSTRRPSKRQKDLADILRLIEVKQALAKLLPVELKKRLEI